jgi:hypothetical protein
VISSVSSGTASAVSRAMASTGSARPVHATSVSATSSAPSRSTVSTNSVEKAPIASKPAHIRRGSAGADARRRALKPNGMIHADAASNALPATMPVIPHGKSGTSLAPT